MGTVGVDVKRALEFAISAHKGQVDKAGAPYVLHAIAVASKLSTDFEKVVGLLHDVVEDTEFTLNDIAEAFGDDVAAVVDVLTHREGEAYTDYISRVAANTVATKVKIADLSHNMDLLRISQPTERDINRVMNKYIPAYAFLLKVAFGGK